MKQTCSGSGIVPIIKDSNNKYYFVLFKSIIRNKSINNLIEDAGGEYEGGNIKISAIRELKEESSLIFNLENLKNKENILFLNKILTKFNIVNENLNNQYYVSHFVHLIDKEKGYFDFVQLRKDYINNMRNFWKNGFSIFTENKDIIFIPIEQIINNNTEYVKDYLNKEYVLFERTYNIFKNLKKNHNIKDFFDELIKNPIILNKKEKETYKYDKYSVSNLITYE